jgi:hypothetical protein
MHATPHPGALVVSPLTPDLVRPAFPLLREAAPELSLAEWLRFARRLAAPARTRREGILAARRAARPFPCGLCYWRSTPDLAAGHALTAEHVVAMDMLDPALVLDALLLELDQVAERLDCRAVRSVVQPGAGMLSARLVAGGHSPTASLFSKRVARLPAAG